jgi:hypothetical protein
MEPVYVCCLSHVKGIPRLPCKGQVLIVMAMVMVMVMVAADHVGYPDERISHLSSDHQEPARP